jgi:hypothetical protein
LDVPLPEEERAAEVATEAPEAPEASEGAGAVTEAAGEEEAAGAAAPLREAGAAEAEEVPAVCATVAVSSTDEVAAQTVLALALFLANTAARAPEMAERELKSWHSGATRPAGAMAAMVTDAIAEGALQR